MTIKAIYENGVFRPLEPVALAERTRVEVTEIPVIEKLPDVSDEQLQAIYSLLQPCPVDPSSPGNLAERHNEHQP